MVAGVRNVSMRSVIIGQNIAPPPPPPPGIHLRVSSGTMTYWSTYQTAYPAVTAAGGSFSPGNVGVNGALSNSDLTVNFSDVSSVFGTSVDATTAWEFLVGSSYNMVLGYWASGLGSNSADLDGPNGGNNGEHSYMNNGDLGSYTGGFSSGFPTYTIGDIIGVVDTGSDIVFYKNGTYVGQALKGGNTPGVILAGRNY